MQKTCFFEIEAESGEFLSVSMEENLGSYSIIDVDGDLEYDSEEDLITELESILDEHEGNEGRSGVTDFMGHMVSYSFDFK